MAFKQRRVAQASMKLWQQQHQTCVHIARRHVHNTAWLAGILLRKTNHVCYAGQSLPGIREFIQNECPVRGIDGSFREQAKAVSLTCSVIPVDSAALVVPGERRLFDVAEQQLERIVEDQGQVLLCCFEPSGGSAGRKLSAPKRGSWSCLGTVAGLQRLPGSSRALVRVLVTDRVAVQAVDSSSQSVIKAQSALLRDRWAYFVRIAALELHLTAAASSSTAGTEVVGAAEQVQDAADELMQLMQQLADTVQAVTDSPVASQLQQLLLANEAADELQDLVAWCKLESSMDMLSSASVHVQSSSGSTEATSSSRSSSSRMPADAALLEKAWRLSFAPYAAKGLSAALFSSISNKHLQSPAEDVGEVLNMTDLGLRLEAALEFAQLLRSNLAAQLALKQL